VGGGGAGFDDGACLVNATWASAWRPGGALRFEGGAVRAPEGKPRGPFPFDGFGDYGMQEPKKIQGKTWAARCAVEADL